MSDLLLATIAGLRALALQLVANPRDAKATPAELCDAELAFFDTVLSLPPNEAGPVLRYLAAGG